MALSGTLGEENFQTQIRDVVEEAFKQQLIHIVRCVEQTVRNEICQLARHGDVEPCHAATGERLNTGNVGFVDNSHAQEKQQSQRSTCLHKKELSLPKIPIKEKSASVMPEGNVRDDEIDVWDASPSVMRMKTPGSADDAPSPSSRCSSPRCDRFFSEDKVSVRSLGTFSDSRAQQATRSTSSLDYSLDGSDLSNNAFVQFVQHDWFESVVMCMVVLQILFLGVQADFSTRAVDVTSQKVFETVDILFCALFAMEIVLKICALGKAYFTGQDWRWSVLNVVLVFMHIFEIVTLALAGSGGMSWSIMRFLRLLRIVRAVRLFCFIPELRSILLSIFATVGPVCWTLLVLISFTFLTSVAITQSVGDVFDVCTGSNGKAVGCPEDVQMFFGSLPLSLLTLYGAVAGGVDWREVVMVLMEHVSPVAGFLLVLHITFVIFTLFNAVTSCFVECTLRAAEDNQSDVLKSMAEEIFQKTKGDRAGSLDKHEFMSALQSTEMQQYFKVMGVDVDNAETLFDIVDINCSGTIEIDEFVRSVIFLKGPAQAFDFVAFVKVWEVAQEHLHTHVKNLWDAFQGLSKEFPSSHSPSLFVSSSSAVSCVSTQTSDVEFQNLLRSKDEGVASTLDNVLLSFTPAPVKGSEFTCDRDDVSQNSTLVGLHMV
eukprot:TRINITY_DN6351_c0_g1_i5.p1 TRINITY_DN6351_c0_g1~~TRINITY_DN6351_c0_g1_i5.p1  ORF type:complete len:670 (-),score=104.88 TRINITY_DN6351_c0_g1_i5:474-2441(-)